MTAKFWELISRGETGPSYTGKEFDLKLFDATKKLIKKYDIHYDPAHIADHDDGMLERIFQAGLELFLETGMLNIDTGKIIRVTEAEIFEALHRAPSCVMLGEGREKLLVRHRDLEDPSLPVVCGGVGNPMTDDARYALYLGYASNPMIDYIEPVPPYQFRGRLVKAGTPFEIQACMDNIALFRKASRDAGRPGMPVKGKDGVSAVTDIATNREDYGYRKSDHANVYIKPALKTAYEDLNRIAQYLQYGITISSGAGGYMGGINGGAEGAAIGAMAEAFAAVTIYQAAIMSTSVMDSIYPNQTSRKAMWGSNLVTAAFNKYTHVPDMWGVYIATAGPCTDMILYEIAACTIGLVANGGHTFGVAPNQGVTLNYCTPMEPQFMGEVGYAATKLTRKQANDISLKILEKYEERLLAKQAPKGKTFQELYNLETLEPCAEYRELTAKVWEELERLGLKRYSFRRSQTKDYLQ